MRVGRPTAFRCASTRAGVLSRAQAEVAREAERRGHADRDALAMDEPRRIVAGQLLQGVAEGVPEVEQRALALLGLVGGDDARLGRAARSRSLRRGPVRRRTRRASSTSRNSKKPRSPISPYLTTSAKPARKSRSLEGIETGRVGQHQRGLMEGADEVLSMRRIDSRLAADAGIDLGEQRRRDLHQTHAPAQRRGAESGKIADHARRRAQ